MSDSSSANPCLACGACCATFRVSFYWTEADDAPGGSVPVALTEALTPHLRCMRGTSSGTPRCVALDGEIGGPVACTIYPLRASPCREFEVFEADGQVNPRCNRARERHGLPPLPAAGILPETDMAQGKTRVQPI